MVQHPEGNINLEKLEIQITELLRLEFEIQEDIESQRKDLKRVQQQIGLLQTQVQLIKKKQLGQDKD